MSLLLFLNELSYATPQPKDRVDQSMERFVRLLNQVAQWRGDASLISLTTLKDMELAPGYYFREWAGQPRHRDFLRGIQRMRNRAPFNDVLPLGFAEGVEYFWQEQPSLAIGAAHLLNGLVVSFLSDECWDVVWLQAEREMLEEGVDGDAQIHQTTVDLRHAAKVEHAVTHEDWIKRAGLPDLRSGADIWSSRADLFPNLQFLPQVEAQLDDLERVWIKPVAYELRRLDDAIGNWDPVTGPEPHWRSKVTPESDNRKQLCSFIDLDGVDRVFDLHGRFTPGPGRVYFRLVPEERRARVAYIGRKLGA
jgi:hypothetical protein